MTKKLVLALSLAALLPACGGGHDEAPAPPPTAEVPLSASASPAGLVGYLKALLASAADLLEPVNVSTVTPPADDAAEPLPVD